MRALQKLPSGFPSVGWAWGTIELEIKVLHFAAVALLATHGSGSRTVHVFAQHIVERAQDLPGLRVMAGLEFVSLLRMARAARLRVTITDMR